MSIKILHLTSSLNPEAGGVSQAIRTMIKGLSITNAAINELACMDDPMAPFLLNDDFKIYALGPGITVWQYAPALLKWLKQNIQDYDIVIVHGLWQYHTYSAFKAWKKALVKPKLFVMPHGMLDPYFQTAGIRKIKAIRNWFFWKIIEKNIVNVADGLLFTCETEKLLAGLPFAPYFPKSEHVVGLGVEKLPLYTKNMKDAFETKLGVSLIKYWLFIGRINEKKGVDLLIKAYLDLKKSQNNLPALVIAGPDADTIFGKQMKTLAQNDPNIYFPGMLSGDSKWGAFYGAEVFILPSHQENFGIAVVESLACGRPVLISDQVNIWREIINAGSGIVGPDNLEGTKNILNTWLALSSNDKEKMVSLCNKSFQDYFSTSSATINLEKALNLNYA